MFIQALISILGLLIVIRTARFFRLKVELWLWVATGGFILFHKNITLLIVLVVVTLFAPIIHRIYLISRFEGLFADNFVSFLDESLLNMRMGVSFYSAIREGSKVLNDFIAQEIIKALNEKTYRPPWLSKKCHHFWLEELRSVQESAHRQVPRLEALRNQIQTLQSFRRKSRSATATIQAQVMVISVLYFGLLFFSVYKWDLREIGLLLTTSIVLYSFGVLLLAVILKKGVAWSR